MKLDNGTGYIDRGHPISVGIVDESQDEELRRVSNTSSNSSGAYSC